MQLAHLTVLLALIASAALLLWWAPWDAPAPAPACAGLAEVDGDVAWPGLLCLPSGGQTRASALRLAGASDPCVAAYVDGARALTGGQRLTVRQPAGTSGACTVSVLGLSGSAALAVGLPLDVNGASVADLQALPGIGPATAARIVDERRARGPFVSLSDLQRVHGVGPKTVDRLRGLATARPAPRSEENR